MLESDGVKLQGFDLRDVLGKTILCEDGVRRKVESIAYSHRYPTRVLVNEIIEDETPGGAYVHALSLSCQMFKNPIPTQEQKDAFDRVMGAMRWQPERTVDKNGMTKLPSGILVKSQ